MKQQLALLSIHRAFWLWFGGIWLFVGLVFLPIGIWAANNEGRFEREAVETTATVLTKGIDRADSDNDSTDYWITYRFTTADGRSFTGRSTVSADRWDELVERGPVAVQYIPSDPSSNRVSRGRDWLLPLVFLGFGAVFTPVGAILFAKGVRDLRRTRALLREGVPTEGTVVRIEDSNHTVNEVLQQQIVYRYADDLGNEYEGSSSPIPPEEAASWSVGDRGLVRYRRDQPRQSIWVGHEHDEPSS